MFIFKILLVVYMMIVIKYIIGLEKIKGLLNMADANNIIIEDRDIYSLLTNRFYLLTGIVPTIAVLIFLFKNSIFTENEFIVLLASIILINIGEIIGCKNRDKIKRITMGMIINKIKIEIYYYWYMIILYSFLLITVFMRGK